MMRNAWTFEVEPAQWIPMPRRERLNDETTWAWVELATCALVEATIADESEVPALRARCTALLEKADDGENCAFIAVTEPFPELVRILTLEDEAAEELGKRWRREGALSLDETPIEAPALTDATRVMRVDDDGEGGFLFGVAFMGRSGDLTAALVLETKQPLVAGQFGGSGAGVFSTFARR